MDNKELALRIAKILDERKALGITVIDVSKKSSFADYLVVCSGASERQIHALTDEVEGKLAQEGVPSKTAEGRPESGWVLLDFGDVIVNVFSPEMRTKYALERVWGDCPLLELPDFEKETPKTE